MDKLSLENVLLFTVFFVPGFIYLKSYRLFFAEQRTDFSKDLYEAFGFSFINVIVFGYPLYYINKNNFILQNTFLYFAILILIIIIVPIIVAFIFYIISNTKWFNKFMINPTKGAWDSFFSKKESYYVIVTLKNGRKIGGKYGLNSYSSTYPSPKEIYIEELWKLNAENGFENLIAQNQGILIIESEISTIEFFI